MRRSLWSFAVMGLSLVSTPGFAQYTNSTSIQVIRHPETGAFPLFEVYPVSPLNYRDTTLGDPDEISANSCFEGRNQFEPNVEVTPGVFCLGPTFDFRLDVNRFATCPTGYSNPFVQSARLTKTVPGSEKMPACYPPQQYFQFGPDGIRTWWSLLYTQPGTTFCLEVTVVCQRLLGRRLIPAIHIDKWVWEVQVSFDVLNLVIDMLHARSLGVLEFPCIADERVFVELQDLVRRARQAATQWEQQNAVMNLEGFIMSECVFTDVVAPDFVLGPEFGFREPPGNIVSGVVLSGGILDTMDNPCCCKLMADVEAIANQGIATR